MFKFKVIQQIKIKNYIYMNKKIMILKCIVMIKIKN